MERLHMCSWLREKSNSGVHFVSQEDFQDKTWGYCRRRQVYSAFHHRARCDEAHRLFCAFLNISKRVNHACRVFSLD